jgi:hypothetical protein
VLLACGNDDNEPPLLLHAMVAFPPKDTILFDLPVTARRCADRRSLLLESLSPEGSGVLLRLRYGDSLTSDSFPIVAPSDTATVPAAIVAIRFFIRDVPRGYLLDSGVIDVRRAGNQIAARTDGVGVETGIRIPARLEYRDVPIGSDTVPCTFQP